MLAEVVLKNEAANAASKPANSAGRLQFNTWMQAVTASSLRV